MHTNSFKLFDCINLQYSTSCDALMTYTKIDKGYQFEIMGKADPQQSSYYAAGGLSFDDNMVSDTVKICWYYVLECLS